LIGRIAQGARPAAIEAEMRVNLKQWLRSHWGEMSAGDRAKFSSRRCSWCLEARASPACAHDTSGGFRS
jgi:hypothetical protein